MKQKLLIITLYLISFFANAQIGWEQRWGEVSKQDEFMAIKATPDGDWTSNGFCLESEQGVVGKQKIEVIR